MTDQTERRTSDTPQFCPSMAYMVRDRDEALVAYQCARPFGHDDERPHRNGIASDAGTWTTEQAMESLEYVLSLMRSNQRQAYFTARSAFRQMERFAHEQVHLLDEKHPASTRNDSGCPGAPAHSDRYAPRTTTSDQQLHDVEEDD